MSNWEDLDALRQACPPGTSLLGPVTADGSMLSVNGQVTAVCAKPDGTRHGPSMSWYENGRKAQAGEYRDDLKEGEWTFWSATGALTGRGAFRAGKAHGDWITYEDGRLTKTTRFHDGKPNSGE
jgi:antitoxin component YwqK of YwqJK toxin-antitoxin module